MKTARQEIIDSVWIVEYQDHGDGTVTIMKHHREIPPTVLKQGELIFRLYEADTPGRIVTGLQVGPKEDYFQRVPSDSYPILKVRNPKNIFSYSVT